MRRIGPVLVIAAAIGTAAPAASAAAPPAPVAVAPSGIVEGSLRVFSWAPAAGATWYRLWVQDAVASPRYLRWYTAAQAGCSGATGTCSLPVELGLAVGAGRWWVQGWNGEGNGPWSAGLAFHVANKQAAWNLEIAGAERFQIVHGGKSVLDRETGLVWERAPATETRNWAEAAIVCRNRAADFNLPRAGWRLPSIEEMMSLFDGTRSGAPYLPAGHPFQGVKSGGTDYYWTVTEYNYGVANSAAAASFNYPFGWTGLSKAQAHPYWCVRGQGAYRTIY